MIFFLFLTLEKYYVWYCLCDDDDDDVGCSNHNFLNIFLFVYNVPHFLTMVSASVLVQCSMFIQHEYACSLGYLFLYIHFFLVHFCENVSHFNGVKEHFSTAKIPWRPLHGWLCWCCYCGFSFHFTHSWARASPPLSSCLARLPSRLHTHTHTYICSLYHIRLHGFFTEKFIHEKWITNIDKKKQASKQAAAVVSKMEQYFTTK